jgi:DNA-directed RNA polymerase specialized sigma24 family protein
MTRITKNKRETVWKLYYEGTPTREIAEIVGLSEFQVVTILSLK